ncbi:hypothetical protein KIN20_005761 [Parelaphostrongylus tenuis]|uniref:Uncharacterized protein n=1 Tax=Parelaphostrongylus tenuis TaxID=148309 RepID=A0AAD5MT72_PARTN|nr:hypothetical protein KIN20_005761 [Parelaphostrongylus tenuis]
MSLAPEPGTKYKNCLTEQFCGAKLIRKSSQMQPNLGIWDGLRTLASGSSATYTSRRLCSIRSLEQWLDKKKRFETSIICVEN